MVDRRYTCAPGVSLDRLGGRVACRQAGQRAENETRLPRRLEGALPRRGAEGRARPVARKGAEPRLAEVAIAAARSLVPDQTDPPLGPRSTRALWPGVMSATTPSSEKSAANSTVFSLDEIPANRTFPPRQLRPAERVSPERATPVENSPRVSHAASRRSGAPPRRYPQPVRGRRRPWSRGRRTSSA
jgi:hypothetical protein